MDGRHKINVELVKNLDISVGNLRNRTVDGG